MAELSSVSLRWTAIEARYSYEVSDLTRYTATYDSVAVGRLLLDACSLATVKRV